MTKVTSIATELKSSRGSFSSIVIKLRIDRQRALSLHLPVLILSVDSDWLIPSKIDWK